MRAVDACSAPAPYMHDAAQLQQQQQQDTVLASESPSTVVTLHLPASPASAFHTALYHHEHIDASDKSNAQSCAQVNIGCSHVCVDMWTQHSMHATHTCMLAGPASRRSSQIAAATHFQHTVLQRWRWLPQHFRRTAITVQHSFFKTLPSVLRGHCLHMHMQARDVCAPCSMPPCAAPTAKHTPTPAWQGAAVWVWHTLASAAAAAAAMAVVGVGGSRSRDPGQAAEVAAAGLAVRGCCRAVAAGGALAGGPATASLHTSQVR
jgi:hypothetical protein